MRAARRPVIAMVTDAIAPYHRGGKELRYAELAPRLAASADVDLYTMRWWRGPPPRAGTGVRYRALCPRLALYVRGRRSILQAAVFAVSCLQLLWRRFDAIEADHMPYLQLLSLRIVASVRRKPLVVTWHEVWDEATWRTHLGRAGLLGWWVERLAMKLPDRVIAASDETAARLAGRLRSGVEVTVAPNGIDLERVRRAAPAADRRDLVVVSRLIAHKRLDLLLDTVAVLRTRGRPLNCRIIGDGPARAELVEHAAALAVSDLVEFRHDVDSQDELYSLLKASRVFVFPSAREGFGIAVLEALACGLAVVTTSAPDNCACALVARSARGVICAPNARALANGVEQVLRGPPGEREDDAWMGEFDWDAIAARVARAVLA